MSPYSRFSDADYSTEVTTSCPRERAHPDDEPCDGQVSFTRTYSGPRPYVVGLEDIDSTCGCHEDPTLNQEAYLDALMEA